MAGAQTTGAVTNQVDLDTTSFDTSSNFNTSTHTFTAPVAGFYHFDANATASVVNSTGLLVFLEKNGAQITQGATGWNGTGSSGNVASSTSALLSLAANDTITMFTFSNRSGIAYAVGAQNCYLHGYLVSNT